MSRAPGPLRFIPLTTIPAVEADANLPALIEAAAHEASVQLADGVLVVCQKIISKAEGRLVDLADVEPSAEARNIAEQDDKDPRVVELVLRESVRVVRHGHGVMICETRHGLVCANAGVDLSNAPGPDVAILLPLDCDASAARLRSGLAQRGAQNVGVIISDTFGRPWREGLVDMAIGSAGIAPLQDLRSEKDWTGRELLVTVNATVDQLAAAAGLLMQKDAGIPAVFVEGIVPHGEGGVQDLLRDPAQDLFR